LGTLKNTLLHTTQNNKDSIWEREVMVIEKTTQWEDAQFRKDEVNGELYKFSCNILKEVTTLNNNAC
jgi:hypothetical protein